MTTTIIHGDCVDTMNGMDPGSVDAIVTDPPYELGFMGKAWDGTGVAFNVATWEAAYRVLKPGGHLLAFGGTRTFHRMAVAIEDAGFEIRDTLSWLYGSGFPKSLDVSKAIDRMAGAERDVMGVRDDKGRSQNFGGGETRLSYDTAPATPDAEQWNGWGTALKPAWEPIIMARKPFPGNVASNVLTHGTGAINVDACRIPGEVPITVHGVASRQGEVYGKFRDEPQAFNPHTGGRWPANVVLDEQAAAMLDEQSGESSTNFRPNRTPGVYSDDASDVYGGGIGRAMGSTYQDRGGASRFFKVVKPDDSETQDVQCDLNCETGKEEPWAKPDHQASTLAESDTPPQRDTTESTSGMGNGDVPSWPTLPNGSATTDPFPMECTSTISTSTNRTTTSVTCNCLTPSPTSGSIPDVNCGTVCGGNRASSVENSNPLQPNTGTCHQRDGHSTEGADRATFEKSLPINGDGEPVARFRYTAKASTSERNSGLTGDAKSSHPTVKPVDLMRWLVRMVTPPGGIVADIFAGSMTTAIAAFLEGFDSIMVEREEEYVAIGRARVEHAERNGRQVTMDLGV